MRERECRDPERGKEGEIKARMERAEKSEDKQNLKKGQKCGGKQLSFHNRLNEYKSEASVQVCGADQFKTLFKGIGFLSLSVYMQVYVCECVRTLKNVQLYT